MVTAALMIALALSPNLEVNLLQPGVFHVSQMKDPYQANSLLVVSGDDYILVDSKNNEADAKLLWDWIKKENPKARLTVFSSHFHSDSTGSNAYYKAQGAKVFTSDLTDQLLEKDGRAAQKGNASFVLKDSPAISVGKELVNVIFPGASHAPDDVVVFFPDRGVLFGSCMTKPGKDLGFLGDADLKSWRQAMEKVKALPAKLVIPGHGTDFDPKGIDNTIKLLDEALKKKPVP